MTHTKKGTHKHRDAAFSSHRSESHGFLCVGSVSRDKSVETDFVVFTCKLDSVSEGIATVYEAV